MSCLGNSSTRRDDEWPSLSSPSKMISEISCSSCNDLQGLRLPTVLCYGVCWRIRLPRVGTVKLLSGITFSAKPTLAQEVIVLVQWVAGSWLRCDADPTSFRKNSREWRPKKALSELLVS